MAAFGVIFGGLLSWPAADYLGRLAALKLGGIPSLCGWLCIYISARITENSAGFQALLFTGRFFTGFTTGWGFIVVPVCC